MSKAPIIPPCSLLPWDSKFWRFPVAKINEHKVTTDTLDSALSWSNMNSVRCLYFAADPRCGTTLRAISDAGGQFVDFRMDLEARLYSVDESNSSCFIFRPATSLDLPLIRTIALKSHKDSRFFKDTHFNQVGAAELYAKWIERDLKEHHLIVATKLNQPGIPLGYVSCQMESENRGRIGLIAVDAQFRGQGLGRGLLNNALAYFESRDRLQVRVATQGSNVNALRLYEGSGFKTIETIAWFHLWFSN